MAGDSAEAIEAALKRDWPKALKLNLLILKKQPQNIEALNRLAMAYLQLGKIPQAKTTYRQVLKFDPYNSIAQKNFKRISAGFSPKAEFQFSINHNAVFLEEPGKTKLVNLINLAPQTVLSSFSPGEPVILGVKKHNITVTKDGLYLGAFPDDITFRLIRLIGLGNKYDAFIKAVGKNSLEIFVHEVKRAKKLGSQPSFPANGGVSNYFPSISKKILSLDENPPEVISDEDEEKSHPKGEASAQEEETTGS